MCDIKSKNISCYICEESKHTVVNNVLIPVLVRDEITKEFYKKYICLRHLEDPDESWF